VRRRKPGLKEPVPAGPSRQQPLQTYAQPWPQAAPPVKHHRRLWLILAAAAACVAVIVGAIFTLGHFGIGPAAEQGDKLNPQTISYLKGIRQKVTIDVLDSKGGFNSIFAPDEKKIEQYPRYNSNITVKFIDLTKNPGYKSKYPKETLNQDDVIVSSGGRYKHISDNSLVNTETDPDTGDISITGYTAEQSLDMGILDVTTQNLSLVTVITGDGEADSTPLQALLENNIYTVKTTNLSTGVIDPETQVIVIAEPKNDLSSAEIKKLDDFITTNAAKGRAKNLFVFFDPAETNLPNLENYVAQWGIGVGTGAIYDETNSVNNNPYYILSGSLDSATVGKQPNDEFGVILDSRPLSLLFTSKGGFAASPVVSSMSTSKLFDPAGGITVDTNLTPSGSDKPGPFTLVAKSVRTQAYNNADVKSTIIVSGSTEAFDNGDVLSTAGIENADIILNSVNNVVGFKPPFNIPPASAK